jgi:hypothetical protein
MPPSSPVDAAASIFTAGRPEGRLSCAIAADGQNTMAVNIIAGNFFISTKLIKNMLFTKRLYSFYILYEHSQK